ncbi:hypothetical protein [Brackiella oedipodis]|uniref:hypothetical protein n=1 Tax=Brackiella oedipodis TaxID=124225 RepID=UPI00048AC6B7|nr:hypothetical protein [Brackiella oedipodis]
MWTIAIIVCAVFVIFLIVFSFILRKLIQVGNRVSEGDHMDLKPNTDENSQAAANTTHSSSQS